MSTKKRRKSKAAQATAAKRAARAAATRRANPAPSAPGEAPEQRPEIVEFEGGGGVMTKLRGGFQSAVGSADAPQKKKKSWLSTVMWALIVIGAVFMFMGSYL